MLKATTQKLLDQEWSPKNRAGANHVGADHVEAKVRQFWPSSCEWQARAPESSPQGSSVVGPPAADRGAPSGHLSPENGREADAPLGRDSHGALKHYGDERGTGRRPARTNGVGARRQLVTTRRRGPTRHANSFLV